MITTIIELVNELDRFAGERKILVKCEDCQEEDPIKRIIDIKKDGDTIIIVVAV